MQEAANGNIILVESLWKQRQRRSRNFLPRAIGYDTAAAVFDSIAKSNRREREFLTKDVLSSV